MKSRSHRPSTNDDWVEEESWTVDCICGVNFDDGEEMVNCDECGVWVHTRCSRYVKSEKLFACDKCKSKNNRNDSEETEVAQLLVELPTKTLRMDNPSSYNPSTLPPSRRPVRLWTDIPIEERVHVQGVPGGDPALFSGLSSVFGPQLWKSSGYVPKKFNFRYREFPSCDKEVQLPKEDLEKNSCRETHNTADNGAGVLLSISRENLLSITAVDTVGATSQAEDVKEDAKVDTLKTLEKTSNLDCENTEFSKPHDGSKDQSLLQTSGKRKKEDLGMLKDKSGKKKTRIVEKDVDLKKKTLHTPGTDRSPKAVKADPHIGKNANLSDNLPAGQLSQGPGLVDHVIDDHECHLASSKISLGKSFFDASRDYSKELRVGHEVPAKLDSSPKTTNGVASSLENTDSASVPVKGEVVCDAVDSSNRLGDGLSSSIGADSSEPVVENVSASLGNSNSSGLTSKMVAGLLEVNAKAKSEQGDHHGVLGLQPSVCYDSKLETAATIVQYQENSADCSSEIDKANGAAIMTAETGSKAEDAGRRFGLVNVGKDGADDVSADDDRESKQNFGGLVDSLEANQGSKGFGSKSVDEQTKCAGTVPSHSVVMGECKAAVSAENSSLASSADVLGTKSPLANHMSVTAQNQEIDNKQKGTSETTNLTSNKDNSATSAELIKDEEIHERPKKLVKDDARSSLNSGSKTFQSRKVSHATASKRTLSDSKETMLHSTPKSPPLPNFSATSRTEQSSTVHPEVTSSIPKKASTSQSESASNVQKKAAVLPQKGEKINQSVSQSSSKVSASLAHVVTSTSSPATLSDEELALLLHQELNSSPRVPRVPRMRHAGSLPQLASPTAPSMMKRTSSVGGKEHILTFRRKAKDLGKDGSHGAREVDEETKKTERVPSSSDHGRQESAPTSDLVSKREVDGAPKKLVQSIKKGNSGLSSSSEANEHNLSSSCRSPRNPPDDGKGAVGRPTHRTLPGLIAEIMSKGERMTYEELCNAVLPHWPNLRKHNGERYAYSSHSQAVLDCLRNRNEWARLVDRGPKTSGGRKRRKLDADPTGIDSEDNEDDRERSAKDVRSKSIESHHEEFPKGKRKARKRRRLALQGRGIKDVRRRRRIEEFSDDEVASFSNSSEETVLSEEAGNEVSPASDSI